MTGSAVYPESEAPLFKFSSRRQTQ